jgi:hypothetical protein
MHWQHNNNQTNQKPNTVAEAIALTVLELIFKECSTICPLSFFTSAILDFDHQNGNDIAPL